MTQPLVLLHAFLASSAMWQPLRAALPGTLELITPDFRGAPGVPIGDVQPSLDVLADDVAALLDERGVDRAIMCGLSMGGYVTMALLRRHPERVAGIVLADTKAGADDEKARAGRVRIAEIIEAEGNTRVAVEELYPSYIGGTTKEQRPQAASLVKVMIEDTPPEGAAWWERAMAARPDSLDVLKQTELPALVIVGDEDPIVTPDDVQAMVDAMPHARLLRIPDAGHFSAIETPQTFASALADFVGGIG